MNQGTFSVAGAMGLLHRKEAGESGQITKDFTMSRGSAGEDQADEQAGVARLRWRVSGR